MSEFDALVSDAMNPHMPFDTEYERARLSSLFAQAHAQGAAYDGAEAPKLRAELCRRDAEIERLRAALSDCVLQLEIYGCDEQGDYMHTVKLAIDRGKAAPGTHQQKAPQEK